MFDTRLYKIKQRYSGYFLILLSTMIFMLFMPITDNLLFCYYIPLYMFPLFCSIFIIVLIRLYSFNAKYGYFGNKKKFVISYIINVSLSALFLILFILNFHLVFFYSTNLITGTLSIFSPSTFAYLFNPIFSVESILLRIVVIACFVEYIRSIICFNRKINTFAFINISSTMNEAALVASCSILDDILHTPIQFSIKYIRIHYKLSILSFSTMLDVTPALISKWEIGEEAPSKEKLMFIDNIYNVRLSSISKID